MARPTLLTPELREKAKEYLKHRMDNVELTEKGALAFVEVQLPSVADFALYLGITRETVYDWSNKESERFDDEFSDIVKEISMEQEKRLLNNGLGGLYAPKVVGMILAKHGYSEKIETDITSKGESLAQTSVVSDLTRQLNDLYRSGRPIHGGASISGNGGTTGSVGTQTPDTK